MAPLAIASSVALLAFLLWRSNERAQDKDAQRYLNGYYESKLWLEHYYNRKWPQPHNGSAPMTKDQEAENKAWEYKKVRWVEDWINILDY